MRRREKFILSSLLLTFALFGIQLVPLELRVLAIALFFFLTYVVSAWALLEDLNGAEWFMIVPFPGVYAIAVSLFYYLLPENIWSRLAILGIFGIGMYALYLTSNIFSVAKMRTIQLLRAAQAIALLFTLIIALLLYNTLFSLYPPFWVNGFIVCVISFPLALFSLWSIELPKKIDRSLYYQAIAAGLTVGELAMVLSFLPASLWTISLYLVSLLYVLLGVMTTKISQRLFKNTVWEYLSVWGVISVIFFVLLEWK